MIFGVGIDNCDIARFASRLERIPALLERLFAPVERDLPIASLAARFAAKEALVKALGGSTVYADEGTEVSIGWQGIVIPRVQGARPAFDATPELQAILRAIGATNVHLSLTHDGNIASAFVVIEKA